MLVRVRYLAGWRASLTLLVVCALALAGCSDGSSGSSGSGIGVVINVTGTSGTTAGGATQTQGEWLLGDLHVHSAYSQDTNGMGQNVYQLIRLAEYAGLDFMVISDHRNVDHMTDPQLSRTQTDLIVISGMEFGGAGHMGTHGLIKDPLHVTETGSSAIEALTSVQEAIIDVHAQGGVAVLNHPLNPKCIFGWPVQGFDAIEVWNSLWAFRSLTECTQSDIQAWEQAQGLDQLGVTAPQTLYDGASHVGGGCNHQALKMWEAHLDRGEHIAAVGGSDAHYLVLPGGPTTRVYAANRSREAVLQGIREGRTVVMRAPNAPRVELKADADGDGTFEAMIGDTVPVGMPLTFQVHVTDAVGGRVDLIKNGQVMHTWTVQDVDTTVLFTDIAAARSWYRLDVYEPVDLSFPQAQTLKHLVLGLSGQSWLSGLSSLGSVGSWLGNVLGNVQDLVETGAPAAAWLVVYGQAMGVRYVPQALRFPVVDWPEQVGRVLNIDPLDDSWSRAAITSPIWAE